MPFEVNGSVIEQKFPGFPEKGGTAEGSQQGGEEVFVPARRQRAAEELPETAVPESSSEELRRGAGNRERSSTLAEDRQRGC